MSSAVLKSKFQKLIKDQKILSMLVEHATRYDNLADFFAEVEPVTAISFLTEVSLRDLIMLKPTNLVLQDEWLGLIPPNSFTSI
jgi:hypothetical protein